MKLLLSLYDHSGNISKPYRENGWLVAQIELKHGVDILKWDYKQFIDIMTLSNNIEKIGIIAPVPCTDYAISGARHFAGKDTDGRTEFSQLLVARTKEIIDYCESTGKLQFWQMENPMSRIHKLNPWMGEVKYKFNPCDHALDNPTDPETCRYNKQTWLWGRFNAPERKRLEPIYKENPGWKLYGGKSERTKEMRSITPMGFCYAFYYANN